MQIKAVLFDIDGTLVDSNDFHVEAWQTAFREAGHDFDAQTLHDQIGKGTDMLVPTLLPGIDDQAAEALGERHGAVFKERFLDRVRPFPHARDLLARVQASGRQVVLASSASSAELDHYLDLLGACDLVAATTTADDVARTKPAPDIFTVALGKVGVEPEAALVVGDTPYDVKAALASEMATVAVRSGGFPDAVLTGAGAIGIYDDVAEILAAFDLSPLAR